MPAKGNLRKILQPVILAFMLSLAGVAAGSGAAAAATATDPTPLPPDTVLRPDLPTATPGAGVSIIRGKATRISDWPWQVAIALRPGVRSKRVTPTARVYCGGSLIAPRLVVTAGHCVSFLRQPKAGNIEVISGRTWLNHAGAGRVTRVKNVIMPRDPKSNLPRYREREGSAVWDVALLHLKDPLPTPAIRLPGATEVAATKPGHTVRATGWGVTRPFRRVASPGLRVAGQVILPSRVCRSGHGRLFSPRLMGCSGGPGGNASTCMGDSGGPLVAPVGGEFRLVGLTSWGDGLCRGSRPSVYTRLGAGPIHNWVATTALRLTGTGVTGDGGAIASPPRWCRVPRLGGLTVNQARARLRRSRCALGTVSRDRYATGRRNRISGVSRIPGWLAPVGFRLQVWLPG